MKIPKPISRPSGFTLIEVLASLGLCALLAAATASAVVFSGRAERIALRYGDASLLVQSLYAAQRLRPEELPAPPRGWRVDHVSQMFPLPDETLREWHQLAIAPAAREIPPFTLSILDDRP